MRRKLCFAGAVLVLAGMFAGCKSEDKMEAWERERDYEAVRAIDLEKTNSIPMQDRIMLQQQNDQQRTNDRMNVVR